VIWRAATAALLVVVALLAWPLARRYREPLPPPPPVVRVPFSAPPGTELGAGDDTLDASISPAGDVIAFVATSNGISQLWQRRVDAEQASALAGTEGARFPAWSPDGQRLAFVAGRRLKQLTLATGALQEMAEVAEAIGVAWLDDGTLVFGIVADAAGFGSLDVQLSASAGSFSGPVIPEPSVYLQLAAGLGAIVVIGGRRIAIVAKTV